MKNAGMKMRVWKCGNEKSGDELSGDEKSGGEKNRGWKCGDETAGMKCHSAKFGTHSV